MNYKILVADDEREAVEVLRNRLIKEGYEVTTAFDGKEALEKVKNDDPDVILLDLIMPNLNGFEVLKEVREKYNDRWRPIVIISAQTDLDTVNKTYSLQADHYLTKPCTIEHILRAITTMISLIPLHK